MLQRIQHNSRELLRAGIDFLYPPCCPLCLQPDGTSCEPGSTSRGWLPKLCLACEQAALPRPAQLCSKCGAPVGPFLDTSTGCIHCKKDNFAFDAVYAIGSYHGLLKQLTWQAKQSYGQVLAATLTHHLWLRHRTTLEACHFDSIVPVPRHWTQNIVRQIDCPQVIAKILGKLLRIPLKKSSLIKLRRTKKQSGLPASQRRTNLKNAFRARENVAGRHLLLIDDILTTGSTAQESAKALLNSGASRVSIAVIARGIGQ